MFPDTKLTDADISVTDLLDHIRSFANQNWTQYTGTYLENDYSHLMHYY